MPSVSFVIDATPLTTKARKPFHLEARMQTRKPVHSFTEKLQRRAMFLHLRKQKLQKHQEQVKSAMKLHKQRHLEWAESTRRKIMSELKLAAAAREEHLTAVKQTHAQIVARAKQVARMHSEKRRRRTEQLRIELEQRQYLTMVRKERLSAVPRSKLMDAESWGFKEQEQARIASALLIQGWYRKCKLAPIVRLYKKMGMNVHKLQALGFAGMMRKLQLQPLIKTARLLLQRAKKLARDRTILDAFKNPGRVFLSIYMVKLYPEETLQQIGAQEEDLKTLAELVWSRFTEWIDTFKAACGRSFLDAFVSYYEAFEAWKAQDTHKIVDDLVRHFMELEGLWISVMHQEDADSEWAPAIQEQQVALLKRISKFGSNAMERLEAQRRITRQQVLDSRGPVEIVSDTPDMTSNQIYRPTQVVAKINVEEPAAPTEPEPEADLSEFGAFLTNEKLAHELVMDPKYTLKAPEKSPFEQQVATIAKKAFTDALREQIQQGVFDKTVFGALMDIKQVHYITQGIISMLSENGAIAAKVNESMEPEFIKHQIEHKTFDLQVTLSYVGHQLLQLCAPIRDPAIRALVSESDAALVIVSLLDVIEEMKLDLANYRLQAVRPHLMQQAVEFERAKFDKAVQEKRVTLERTTAWLKESFDELRKTVGERNPEGWEHRDLKVKHEEALNNAYLSLLFSKTPVEGPQIAETLVLDAERVFAIQNELQALGIVASLSMVSKNMLPAIRSDEKALGDLKKQLFAQLQDPTTNIDTLTTMIVAINNESMKRKAESMSKLSEMTTNPSEFTYEPMNVEATAAVRTMVEKTVSYKDPVFALLTRRLAAVIRLHLEKGTFKHENLHRHGLDIVAKELSELSARIVALCQHNKKVHYTHYNRILDSLIQ